MRKIFTLIAAFVTIIGGIAVSPSPVAAAPKPIVYLTFDDGPRSGATTNTSAFLDLLKSHGAKGTFFVNGININTGTVPLLHRIVNEGHALGNHSWSHANLTTLSHSQVVNEFTSTNTSVALNTPNNYQMTCYRPPYGASNSTVISAANAAGLTNSQWTANYPAGHGGGWDIDSQDWRYTTTQIRNELNKIKGGEVVLMHDGGGNRAAGYAALSGWLSANANNFEFRPLPGCGAGDNSIPVPNPTDSSRWFEFSIERLYQAYFLRPSDAGGFDYWRGLYLNGLSLGNMSTEFSASAEFKSRYGSLSNAGFIELVYNNVMGRPSDAAGKNYWLSQLNGGMSRGNMMLYFSDSDEYANLKESVITGGSNYETEASRRYNAG